MILDFHSHTFPEAIAAKAMNKLSAAANIPYFTSATNDSIRKSMERSGVDVSLILPVVTAPSQTETVNRVAIELNQREEAEKSEKRLISFGGLHPENANYKEVLSYIKSEGIKGIKLHPVFQGVPFNDIRYKRIVSYCMEQDLIVLTHAGYDLSHPDNANAATAYMTDLVKDTRPDKLVLAHMGGYGCWYEIEELVSEYKLYVDTGFSVKNVRRFTGPYNIEANAAFDRDKDKSWWPKKNYLSDEQFMNIVKAAGEDHVLFGSDSPWNDQKEAVDRIRESVKDEKLQKMILGENAAKFLKLS